MASRPALLAASAVNVVMVLSMASVLAVPVMAPAISADTGLQASLLGAYSFVMWSAATLVSGTVSGLIARLGAPRVVQLSLILGPVAFSAVATAVATLGAGYLLLAGATFAGALVLRRAGHERPRAV